MKKLLSVLLLASVLTAQAREVVTIIYSWTASDTAANFHRSLADEANKIQDKYTFIFDTKPGAGGSVAANYILSNSQNNSILANSSAFFIRPNFFPVSESHDIGQFKELLPVCSAPIVIASKKYKSWNEVPHDKSLSIGISGLGTTTHLVVTQLAKKYPNLVVIPFKSTSEAVLSVLNGTTDFSVNFLGDIEQYKEGKNQIYALGITGNQTVAGVKTLASEGFSKDLELMNSPAQLLVPANMSDSKFKEWREILLKAGRSQVVLDSFKPDHCQDIDQAPDAEIQTWYHKQTNDWRRLTQGVSLQ